MKNTKGIKIRTHVRAGGINLNHNANTVRGLKIRTHVRAGGVNLNHNANLIRR